MTVTETVHGYARIDHGRAQRTGLPEVVFGEGKSVEQLRNILKVMHIESIRRKEVDQSGENRVVAMATRVSPSVFAAVSSDLPTLKYYQDARIAALHYDSEFPEDISSVHNTVHDVAVLCAGTSDFAVAEEAAVTLNLFGLKVARLYDVGVAGLHRLLVKMPIVRNSKVCICVAGMDGALPSVVGGLVS